MKSALAVAALLLLSSGALGIIYLLTVFVQVSRSLPSISAISNWRPAQNTTLYFDDTDATGRPRVLAVLATQNRQPVELSEISQNLVDATIAVEDARFYQHQGVDYYGIARALVRNVAGGAIREGASTITQQLARNMSELGLTRERRVRRKVAEAILAIRIEQTFTKEEILELYLNEVSYGNGAYGAEAAARTYFGKSCRELTLAEAAFLAGLPQRPSAYGQNPDLALQRRNTVLRRMQEAGKITAEQRAKASAMPGPDDITPLRRRTVFGAPHFVDYVVAQIRSTYGPDAIYSGWRIHTTLDSRIQAAAERALRDGIRNTRYGANQGCLISIDPATGFIRAMVGGLDYGRDQFNAVVQGLRQPGSAFKPIVYAAAIDQGVTTLQATYRDDQNFPWRGRDNWLPTNYGGRISHSRMTVLNAIARSTNTIAVKVAVDVGIPAVIDYARRMGITSELAPYLPLALGASAVRPIELCSAFSLFANGGQRAIPMAIRRILTRDGELIDENAPTVEDPRLRPETVEAINTALAAAVRRGTGTAAARVPNAHGKTGTTTDNRDAWFVGYTPELATAVWVARERRDSSGRVVGYWPMRGATGGQLCAPIWREFMLAAVPIQRGARGVAPPPRETQAPRSPAVAPPQPAEAPDPAGEGATLEPAPSDAAPAGSTGDAPPEQEPAAEPAGRAQGLAPSPAPPAPTVSAPTPGGRAGIRTVGTETPVAARDGVSGPRLAEPRGRPEPPRRRDATDEVIAVNLCVDTMLRATRWCDTTIERRMRQRDVPRTCRTHRGPPGE
ncbi:MAG TPA: PBP1A family penicillin-binding protein [Chthonomonadales bacterium]|nr:PBP1A family penicillin-binding protein [Chthonomonadales bacterium]